MEYKSEKENSYRFAGCFDFQNFHKFYHRVIVTVPTDANCFRVDQIALVQIKNNPNFVEKVI